MKIAILIIALVAFTAFGFAQTKSPKVRKSESVKKDTVQVKPKYKKFFAVPEQTYYLLIGAAQYYKDGLIYNPLLTDKEQRSQAIDMSGLINYLNKNMKIDSVIVSPVKK
jgi:hypothetical protein